MSNDRPGLAKLFQGVVSRLLLYYATLSVLIWSVWAVMTPDTRLEVRTALAPILGGGGASIG